MAEKFQQPPPYSAHNPSPSIYPNFNQPISSAPGSYPGYVPQETNQTIIIKDPVFGPFPVRIKCPRCQLDIVTETHSEAGLLAWLLCGACCLVGCVFGCCLIPCCIDSCRNVIHKCPSCKSEIALYKRL